MFTARSVSDTGIIYQLTKDVHTGGTFCSGMADVIFVIVVSSNTVQKIFRFTRHIFINIKSTVTVKRNKSS